MRKKISFYCAIFMLFASFVSAQTDALSIIPSSAFFVSKFPNIEKLERAYKENPLYKLYFSEKERKDYIENFIKESWKGLMGRLQEEGEDEKIEKIHTFLEAFRFKYGAFENTWNKFERVWVALGRPSIADTSRNITAFLGILYVFEFPPGNIKAEDEFSSSIASCISKISKTKEKNITWRGINVSKWVFKTNKAPMKIFSAKIGNFFVLSFFEPWFLFEAIDTFKGIRDSISSETWARSAAYENNNVSASLDLSFIPYKFMPSPYSILLSEIGIKLPKWINSSWYPKTGNYSVIFKKSIYRKSVLTDLANKFNPGNLASFVPSDTAIFMEFPADMNLLWKRLETIYQKLKAEGFFKGEWEGLEERINKFEEEVFRIRDFIKGIKSIGVAFKKIAPINYIAPNIPNVCVILKVDNGALQTLKKYLFTIAKSVPCKIRKRYEIDTITFRGKFKFLVAFREDAILFVPRPIMARSFLPAFAGKGDLLSGNETYKTTLTHIKNNCIGYIYWDSVRVTKAIEKLVVTISSFASLIMTTPSLSELPHDEGELKSLLSGNFTAIYINGDDLVIKSDFPFSLVNVICSLKLGFIEAFKIFGEMESEETQKF